MRLPFDFDNSNLNEGARIKLSYTSPELHQNIEISIDGDEVSIDVLLDSFERFMGALGICIPENAILGFIEMNEEDEEDEDEDNSIGGTVKFTLDDDEDDDEDEEKE